MSGETVITVVGNLTADPELRFTPSGSAVANFTIASTPRVFDASAREWKDGEPLFLRCSLWRESAENLVESLGKGARVIVQGRLKSRAYETKDGEKRTVVELEVDEVGASLRFSTVKAQRAYRGQGSGGGSRQPGPSSSGGQPADDPWATPGDPGSSGSGSWGSGPDSEPPY